MSERRDRLTRNRKSQPVTRNRKYEPLHVSMDAETYARLSREERAPAWESLIRKAGVTGSYLPVPFEDKELNIVGMNIVRFEDDQPHD